MIRVAVLGLVLFALASLLAATTGEAGSTQNPKLVGTVGPEFEIALRDAQGNRVTKLDPGTYDIEVRDLSDFHSFHLEGPGVDERTEVAFTGTVNWTVTFRDGNYNAHCDPHPELSAKFVVGNPATAPPQTGNVVTPRSRLVLTSGPAEVITLKTSAGKTVKQMKLGTYRVRVRDRGRDHNAHVRAPGFDRKTKPLAYTGTQTWTIKLARTGSFRFLCDPHAITGMKGSAKIVR